MIDLRLGDCLEVLKTLPDGSVHTCVTSPPYWGLRDYGCDGQIGLEATPDAFVGRMVEVFREVRRCLRDDGTLWLNLGDSYARWGTDAAKGPGANFDGKPGAAYPMTNAGCKRYGLKHKDLVGIPWRVAFALQADGYYLRSDIVWHKPNPMPESVRDRPTKSHEYLFLMAKSERYFWDAEAVREPLQGDGRKSGEKGAYIEGRHPYGDRFPGHGGLSRFHRNGDNPTGRNIRSVWTIATRPYKGAHFATFPPRLIEPCVKAGTSERGCCPECGKPWERVVERTPMVIDRSGRGEALGRFGRSAASGTMVEPARSETLGWRPTCNHDLPPIPCTVLDPFMGSGTTGAVAAELGRSFVGIELNPEYLKLAEARIAGAKVA